MANIWLLTSHPQQRSALTAELQSLGHSVVVTDRAALAEATPEGRPPNLVIVDIDSQGTAAVDVLREREDTRTIPVLGVATEQALDGTALLVKSRVSDFIVRPYSVAELDARVKGSLWEHRLGSGAETIQVGGLVIDTTSFEVSIEGQPIDLTYREYELLRFLASNRRRVFTRGDLLRRVWGYDYLGGTRTVDVHVRRVRAKLGPEHGRVIETVRNVGYKFRA
jgi:DNA-binding response OmpR family regulator